MVGALVAGGVMVSLLPDFAEGRRKTEERSSSSTDAYSNTDGAHIGISDPPISIPSLAGRWQNLPLLASQEPDDIAVGGEVEALVLQVAFDRERNRADAAQLQVASLQGQIASLKEKHEVLREQAENALLKAAESHEKLENLRASVVEAQKAEESEREKASAAREQLEAVKGQLAATRQQEDERTLREQLARRAANEELIAEYRRAALKEREEAVSAREELESVKVQLAALTAQVSDGMKTKGQLEMRQDQDSADPLFKNREELPLTTPNLQLPLETNTPPKARGEDAQHGTRQDIDKSGTNGRARQVSLQPGARLRARPDSPDSNAATARVLSRKYRTEPEAANVAKWRRESPGQRLQSTEKASPKASQRPRLLTQDVLVVRSPGALSLPSALLPDDGLW
ncbi:hypothetical protein DC522_03110 [Microvirga sp. KLBC 81]|uniref:hypothetical protein n=1 Tax=Microvirga sp. KLBC 81 TaxID=1862707 RepID=UPI000D50CF24|nr:hypothetical protein [Microvirga sp. KLBC 81]PVE25776.1 hypothetical protein DC522_03110 [Microvirga sp. KLBC 81]